MININMKNNRSIRTQGFTLVELAIVLAVAALLMAGLWRLMSSGNNQMQDQAAADQAKQLNSAVQAYLNSPEGRTNLRNTAANGTFALPLPAPGAACAAPFTNFCNFLPVGFNNATTNPYGQTYQIRVQKDNQAAGTDPNRSSFMVLTTGGNVIPDSSGGRIAAALGNDGGFLYTANVCTLAAGTAANSACGAYGSWAVSTTAAAPAGYGFAAAASVSGHLASRTIVAGGSGGTLSVDPWLARIAMPAAGNLAGVDAGLPDYNTIQTDVFLSSNGTFNMNGRTIFGGTRAAGNVAGTITNIASINANRPAGQAAAPVVAISNCFKTGPGDAACPSAIDVRGDQVVSGLLTANQLYAGTFIYNAPSDFRLKHDVKLLDNPLGDLAKIKGVSFVMNQNGEKKLGVIAQDVEKVYPQLVSNIGGDYKGVDYVGLIGPIVGAINQLREENEALKMQLKLQAREIKALKAHSPIQD